MNHKAITGMLIWGVVAVSAIVSSGCASRDIIDDALPELGGGAAITAWTEHIEWFFEHPPLVAGETSDAWAMHVTYMDSFKPVTEGSLLMRFRDPSGAEQTITVGATSRDGIFSPQSLLPVPGTYSLTLILNTPTVTDTLEVEAIQVFASVADLPPVEEDTGSEISFLKEQQWVIPFATAEAAVREVQGSIAVSGQIMSVPGRLAEIATPVSGLVLPEFNRSIPSPGSWVQVGEVLAILAPSEPGNSYASRRAEVNRLELEVDRLQRLMEMEAIPRKRLDDALRDLEVARSAFQSIGGESGGDHLFHLEAPIDGLVIDNSLVLGSVVEAGERLFTIVDPRTVWLKVRVPALYTEALADISGASFTVEGGSISYFADRIISTGSIIDPASRSIPVLIEVPNREGTIKIGMLADVRLILGRPISGTAIPNQGIQNEDGIPVTYVQTSGEGFERRVLTLGATDGTWTLVTAGLAPGDHVVILGSYQVRLASLSTSELASHGHVH